MTLYREIGATTSCAIRTIQTTAKCGQKTEDHVRNLYYGDSWFSSVKTCDAVVATKNEWVGPVKTAHKNFPKAELEKLLENWPGGSYLVLESEGDLF